MWQEGILQKLISQQQVLVQSQGRARGHIWPDAVSAHTGESWAGTCHSAAASCSGGALGLSFAFGPNDMFWSIEIPFYFICHLFC